MHITIFIDFYFPAFFILYIGSQKSIFMMFIDLKILQTTCKASLIPLESELVCTFLITIINVEINSFSKVEFLLHRKGSYY